MSKYYKRALEIFETGFDAKAVALHYAQNYPKAFCDAFAETGQEEKYIKECRDMMRTEGMKIQAIKHWRNHTGSSLKDAKEAVECLV